VHHLHPRDILLHPIGLKLTLLPVGQEEVDGVLQPTLVVTDPRCDGLPGGVSNSVAVRGPESWSLVSAEDFGSEEDLCNGFELHPPWTWDFLDPVPGAVVMPRCSSRARIQPVRTGASALKDSTSSASWYIFSSSVSLRGEYSSLALCHTRFLSQNQMLIVCVPRNQIYTHTVQKMETE
jgi:hypothetical protein